MFDDDGDVAMDDGSDSTFYPFRPPSTPIDLTIESTTPVETNQHRPSRENNELDRISTKDNDQTNSNSSGCDISILYTDDGSGAYVLETDAEHLINRSKFQSNNIENCRQLSRIVYIHKDVGIRRFNIVTDSEIDHNDLQPDADVHVLLTCLPCKKRFPSIQLLRSHALDVHGDFIDQSNCPSSGRLSALIDTDLKLSLLRAISSSSPTDSNGNVSIAEEMTLNLMLAQELSASRLQQVSKNVLVSTNDDCPSVFVEHSAISHSNMVSTNFSSNAILSTARNSCKTLKCPKCNWHYKYQETLEIHMNEKHSESEIDCDYCIQNQPHPKLTRGETYGCGYKPYRCDICRYSTTTKGNLSIHMQSDKHLNNMHELQQGNKQFDPSEMIHSDPPPRTPTPKSFCLVPAPFRCDFCLFETGTALNLRLHLTGEKHGRNMRRIRTQLDCPTSTTSTATSMITDSLIGASFQLPSLTDANNYK